MSDRSIGPTLVAAEIVILCGCGSASGSSIDVADDPGSPSRAGDGALPDVSQADAPIGVPAFCTTVPSTCPTPSPTFDDDIAPIINA